MNCKIFISILIIAFLVNHTAYGQESEEFSSSKFKVMLDSNGVSLNYFDIKALFSEFDKKMQEFKLGPDENDS